MNGLTGGLPSAVNAVLRAERAADIAVTNEAFAAFSASSVVAALRAARRAESAVRIALRYVFSITSLAFL